MGVHFSPITANIIMEETEQTALNTYIKSLSLWVSLRYADDVHAIMQKIEVESFDDYLHTISRSVKFPKELEKLRQLVFLDVNVQQLKDGPFVTSVYRKPTHTNRCLQYLLITLLIKNLVWLVHYSEEPIQSHVMMEKRLKTSITYQKRCRITDFSATNIASKSTWKITSSEEQKS